MTDSNADLNGPCLFCGGDLIEVEGEWRDNIGVACSGRGEEGDLLPHYPRWWATRLNGPRWYMTPEAVIKNEVKFITRMQSQQISDAEWDRLPWWVAAALDSADPDGDGVRRLVSEHNGGVE